jgi:oxygen-independent coproporphyrinogen-3 oxidase
MPTQCIDAPTALQQLPDSAALLAAMNRPRVAGLYLHVPFCFHKCHYCDFYSIVDDHDRQAAFADRMVQELHASAPLLRGPIQTIFVGGGTPTLLRAELWRKILAALHAAVDLSGLEEFTIEANPETVTPGLLEVLVAGGVNRMSIGAQSFNPVHLKTLERWHDPANVGKALAMARAAGIGNVNLDLIFAVPGQTLAEWRDDMGQALALGPDHLSCYSLMFESNTPLTQKLKMGLVEKCDEDLEAEMFRATIDTITAAGFEHYEVSNFAKLETRNSELGSEAPPTASLPSLASSASLALKNPSFRCRHNLLYWLNENWHAIGPSASGHLDGVRWKNTPHLGKYLATTGGAPIQDVEKLNADASIGEQLMLRLRLLEGAPTAWLDSKLNERRRAAFDKMVADGLLEPAGERVRLTPRGLMIADSVFTELL